MIRTAARLLALVLSLVPAVAAAQPIILKLAYFSSDRTHLYLSGAKPFVDAVNFEGRGRVKIEPYFSGSLGKDLSAQSKLAADGTADFVYLVASYEQAKFPDTRVVELPGLYRDAQEATFVFSRLVANSTIRGFDDFVAIGAFASEPETIHTRSPVSRLADLKGMRIRVNNDFEYQGLEKLGITPVRLPIVQTALAISRHEIDGAAAPPAPMIEFGIGRVAPNHYMLGISCVPQMLLMNRKRFEGLPADIQEIIRKYSGTWFADNYNRINEAATKLVMNQITADPARKVIFPSSLDSQTAEANFDSIIDDFAASNAHNAELVRAAREAVAMYRSDK